MNRSIADAAANATDLDPAPTTHSRVIPGKSEERNRPIAKNKERASATLCPGDYVTVKSPDEILTTLDAEGTIDQLPFMPEMIEFCGRRFKIARRAVTTCMSGADSPRLFSSDDVFTLENLRCSGAAHDGCQKACMIFWRQAWLRKVDDPGTQENKNVQSKVDWEATERLRARLKVMNGPKRYFCQATELSKVTFHLASRVQKFASYFREYRAGNFTLGQLARVMGIWLLWRVRLMLFGIYSRGRKGSVPDACLDLQPSERVTVKPIEQIRKTTNKLGQHRGLLFSPDMRLFCGESRRVLARLDRIIMDDTGEMRKLKNTVILEDSTCGCAYLGLGRGCCSRKEHAYWREAWLDRTK